LVGVISRENAKKRLAERYYWNIGKLFKFLAEKR
jgi:hypothetical protein